jgi:hypothetical protein
MTDPRVTHRVVNERGEPTWRTGSPPASSTQTTQPAEATAAVMESVAICGSSDPGSLDR